VAIDALMSFAGTYDNVEDAEADYQLVQDAPHPPHEEYGLISDLESAALTLSLAARAISTAGAKVEQAAA
jgi:hypothetical protein